MSGRSDSTQRSQLSAEIAAGRQLRRVPNIPPIVELDYSYDKVSNRTKMLDNRPGASQNIRDMVYTYDGLDRLSEAKRGVEGGFTRHSAVAAYRGTRPTVPCQVTGLRGNDGDWIPACAGMTESARE